MTKNFYSDLVIFQKIEKLIKETSMSLDEKEELWKIIDEIVHHRVMGCVLENLPREHHEEFLTKFKESPEDADLIDFLESKSGKKVSEEIKKELVKIEEEILNDIN